MGKAILSNKIYLDVDTELQTQLIKALTYKIKKNIPGVTHFSQFEIVKNYKIVGKGIMSIPIGRQDLIPEDYTIIDKRVTEAMPFPNPKHELREGQQVVFDLVDDTCFINALVGWGRRFAP